MKELSVSTSLRTVDDVAGPRVVDTLQVVLLSRPVAANDQMVSVQPTSPAVHYAHLVHATDHWSTPQHS